MRTISLFAGCGGLDLGAERAGCRVVYANEIDGDACTTLRQYFPHLEVDERDVASIDRFPEADLLVGGYPCQSFSMGGNRDPEKDHRTYLYLHFARCLAAVRPSYFVAENVAGLKKLRGGAFLKDQFEAFQAAGYRITAEVVNARDYGVPQTRKRMILVGVRKDIRRVFVFPRPTHGIATRKRPFLRPFTSHGEAIKDLPLWPKGEFYERPHDPEGHFSWYYMSRNRKAEWDSPSYAIVANWRHITLHPASPVMKLTWSNLADGWKQRWDFAAEYEHTAGHPERPVLQEARRLSWRECAAIQGFPRDFEPSGDTESKFTQVGNAVPVELARVLVQHVVSGEGLYTAREGGAVINELGASTQLTLWG
jgi:DNA (cytosine-5)-methyltransferase 1